LIAGISSTLFHVPGPVVINRVAGVRTGRGMSFYMLGGELARTLGPLFVLAAVSWWGLEGTVRLIPLGVAASLLLWTQIPASRESLPTAGRVGRDIWRATWRLRRFFLLLFGVVWFRSLPKTAMTIFLPTFMTEQGSGLVMAGSSLAILQFAGAAGTLLAGSLSDTLGRRWVLLLAALVSPVWVWLFLTTSGVVAMVCLVASGFTLFASGPVLLALVQDYGAESPATINGVYMTINFLIQSAMAFLIGVMGDHFGLMLTFKLSAVISVAAVPFIWALSERNQRS
jgi:FSR family fosmidomycin resistance protein-like MFS transporter